MSPTMEITYRDGSRVMRVVVPVSSPEAVVSRLTSLGAEVVPTVGEPLSEREYQVARYVRLGWANRRIASELGISEGTVKRHVSNILEKRCYESRTQLALALGA